MILFLKILSRSTVQDYAVERIVPIKLEKVDDALMVPFMASAIDFRWLHIVTQETISEVKRDYHWCCRVTDGDAG